MPLYRDKLGRTTAHKLSMLKTMVTQLIEHERIQTTLAKARQLRITADRMITLGKKGDHAAHVRALGFIRTDRERHKLFTVLAERYRQRQGGYTRVVKTGPRERDAAKMAYVEFVDRPGELWPARPPKTAAPSLLPPSAQAALRRP